MTSKKCLTGTDRIAEVSKKFKANFYLNIQGINHYAIQMT